MFMRIWGGGIGHKATWDWNDILLRDVGKPVDHEDGDEDSMMKDSEVGSESESDEDEEMVEATENPGLGQDRLRDGRCYA